MLGTYSVIGNWWLQEKLGSGYSGSIYKAINIHTRQVVALKIQDVNHECPTNRYERSLYPLLQGGEGMPTLWAAGIEGQWDYLAIDLLGASLETLYRTSEHDTMDLRSVCCIAMQVISRLEFMHNRGILHRDIQLGNCVVGLPPNEKTIYMIDFGFSKRYIDPYTNRHIPDSTAKRDFIGNFWFTSVGVHCRGKVPSRRDDLEAVALMLIHLLTPRGLSWTRNGVPKTDSAFDRLENEKRKARPETLCKGLPEEFEEFLRYCRRLKFKERPDYAKWREAFRDLAQEEGFSDSDQFIWPPPQTKPRHAPNILRRAAAPAIDVERVLNDLANLRLDQRQILGDRQNVTDAIQNAKNDAKAEANNSIKTTEELPDVVEISSDSEGTIPPRFLTPKAYKLNKLTQTLSGATDNLAVSRIITEFTTVLQANSSRTLTKEGFAFLDVLYKRLADPSVFVMPLRTSRRRSSDKEQIAVQEPRVKLGVVARLRREVEAATGNGSLAKMVADFGAVTNKSNGRTVTKDGFAFLEGLARKLKELDSL